MKTIGIIMIGFVVTSVFAALICHKIDPEMMKKDNNLLATWMMLWIFWIGFVIAFL